VIDFPASPTAGDTYTAAGTVWRWVPPKWIAGTGSGITQLTGDVTAGPGSGSVATTLAATAVTPGAYTNSNITVDGKGRITAATSGTASITVSDTPPASPVDGQLWFDGETACLFVYFVDSGGGAGQWIVAVNQPGSAGVAGATGPTGPAGSTGPAGPAWTVSTGLTLSGSTLSLTSPVALINGGTGAITAPLALTALGALPVAGGTITGSLTVNNTLSVNSSVNINNNAQINFLSLPGGHFNLYDDGNSHLESSTNLWLNSNGNPTTVGGSLSVYNTIGVTHSGGVPVVINTPVATDCHLEFHNGTTGDWKLGAMGYTSPGEFWIYDIKNSRSPVIVSTSGQLQLKSTGSTALTLACETAGGQTELRLNGGRSWLVGSLASGNFFVYDNNAPQFRFQIDSAGATFNTTGTWSVISDASLKVQESIEPYERGLEALMALNPVMFQYAAGTPFAKEDEPSAPLVGLLAHEVEPHIPEMCGTTTVTIGEEEREIQTLSPGDLTYVLVNAVKELAARVEELEHRLD
jgi:hypothetical protein